MSTMSTYDQQHGLATWPSFSGSTPREGYNTQTVNSYGMNFAGVPNSPSGSGAGMVDYVTGLPAPPGGGPMDNESIQSIEEEKVQQLRNVRGVRWVLS